MTNQLNLPVIPPSGVTSDHNDDKNNERQFRTALAPRDYLRLEIESMDRGLKPYGLTKIVMTLYLHKQLVHVRELPQEIQVQIFEYYRNKKNAVALKGD